MIWVYVFFISLLLIGIFVVTTRYEHRRGTRFFAARRTAFDLYVRKQKEILTDVDTVEIIIQSAKYLAYHTSRIIVTLLHFVVQKIERLLERTRAKLHSTSDGDDPSTYVQTMKDFRDGLRDE